MNENEISYNIRGAILKVFNTLGPGLFENVYKYVIKYALEKAGLSVKMEVPLPVVYDNQEQEIGYKIDLMFEDKVIIKIKSVERLSEVHHKQVITYLKLSNRKLGILVNFNTAPTFLERLINFNNLCELFCGHPRHLRESSSICIKSNIKKGFFR